MQKQSVLRRCSYKKNIAVFVVDELVQKHTAMKTAAILCAVLGIALAKPNGYYQQAYNYQTSSSSYKNQELQHHNEDKGFYSQEGDLEGRVRPRVNSHSQHSEYVNPRLKQGPGEPAFNAEIQPVGHYGYMGHAAPNVNLRQVCTTLQEELAREMQSAVYDHYRRATAYSNVVSQAQMEADMRAIQEDLRRNMTMRLEEAIRSHFGQQGIRGGYYYTIQNGRLQPTANFHTQELEELKRQMEAHLMRQLEQQFQTYYHTTVNTEVHTRRNTYRRVNEVSDNYPAPIQQRPPIYHPYPPQQPVRPVQAIQHVQIPVHIPDSITTVATRVQTELNEHLNRILEDAQRRYFTTNNYHNHQAFNYDTILAQLIQELRANITVQFDEQIQRTYGYTASKYSMEDIENLRRQIENNLVTKLTRDFNRQREKFFQNFAINTHIETRPPIQTNIPANHMYYPPPNTFQGAAPHTVHFQGPAASTVHYQGAGEFAAIQRQMQESLSRQLQDALMRQSYRQAHMYHDQANFNPQSNYQATLNQLTAELNRNLTRQMEQFYHGQNYRMHEAQLASMRNQIQQDLMRQLQQGLQQSYSRYASWSSSSSSSHHSNYRPVRGFDANLYRSYGGSDAATAGEDCMMGDDPSAYQQEDEEDLSKRKDEEIPAEDEDATQKAAQDSTEMLGDDPSAYQQQTQDDEDLTQQVQTNDDLTQQVQTHDDLTQQVQTHDALTQQSQDLTQQVQSPQQTQDLTQQFQTVQAFPTPVQALPAQTIREQPHYHTSTYQTHYTPVYRRYPSPYFPSSSRDYYHRYPSSVYYTPSHSRGTVQERVQYYEGFSRPRTYQQTQQTQEVQKTIPNAQYRQIPPPKPFQPEAQTQNVEVPASPTGLGQQTEDIGYGNLEVLGQQTDDSDLTQQVQQPLFDGQTQQVQTPNFGQQTEDFARLQQQRNQQVLVQQSQDLGQQTEDFGRLQQQTHNLGQQTEGFGRLQQPQNQQAQQIYDLGQQTEDFGGFQQQNQQLRQIDDLGQQTEDFGKLQQPQNQVQYIQDLGQQTEDFGSLQQNQRVQQIHDLGQQTEDFSRLRQPQNLGQNQLAQGYPQYVDRKPNIIRKPIFLPTQQTQNQPQQDLSLQKPSPVQYPYPQTPTFLPQQKPNFPQQSQNQYRDITPTENQYQENDEFTQKMQKYFEQNFQDSTQQNIDEPGLGQQTQQLQDLEQGQHIQDQQFQQFQNPQGFSYRRWKPKQVDDLTQQTEDDHFAKLTQQQAQVLTQQQQVENVEQLSTNQIPKNKPSQQTEDLTQQIVEPNQKLVEPNQQSQDLTQQIIEPDQQSQDLTQQVIEPDQQYQDLTQQVIEPDQQSQDLTQQVLEPDQQTQDLTQQVLEPDQQTQDLTQQVLEPDQQTQDLTQQVLEPDQETQDLTQQVVEPDQQTQDLTQQQTDLTDQQRLAEARRDSQLLIDSLRGHIDRNQQVDEPGQNQTKPIYQNPERQGYQPSGRSLINNQVNYPTQEDQEENTETVQEIEPVQAQTADQVQQVDPLKTAEPAPAAPEVLPEPEEVTTTKKPGWWSRVGTSIKNKAIEYKQKIG